jgi:hypothetical protein
MYLVKDNPKIQVLPLCALWQASMVACVTVDVFVNHRRSFRARQKSAKHAPWTKDRVALLSVHLRLSSEDDDGRSFRLNVFWASRFCAGLPVLTSYSFFDFIVVAAVFASIQLDANPVVLNFYKQQLNGTGTLSNHGNRMCLSMVYVSSLVRQHLVPSLPRERLWLISHWSTASRECA